MYDALTGNTHARTHIHLRTYIYIHVCLVSALPKFAECLLLQLRVQKLAAGVQRAQKHVLFTFVWALRHSNAFECMNSYMLVQILHTSCSTDLHLNALTITA